MDNPIDWQNETQQVVENLQRLIRIDTTNPPGNELPAALMVREILEKNGIARDEIQILEPVPNRGNLIVRLRGDGSQRPMLLSGHLDVVGVEREFWERDPFGGELVDGEVWGRGAIDMKGFLAMYLQVFMMMKRYGLPLKRDLILVANADEEAGFTYGSKFLVQHHRELIDAEYGITEGGSLTMHAGKYRLYTIQVAEKAVCWLKVTAKGQPGHGSMPHSDNAVLHLSKGLDQLRRKGHLPVHLSPAVKGMIDSASRQIGLPLGIILRLLNNPIGLGFLLNILPQKTRPLLGAFLTNTASPNVLLAGGKTNVIPSTATAHIDCRLIPGQKPSDVIQELKSVMGEGLEFEILITSDGAEFPLDSSLYQLIEQKTREMDPEGIVVPMMMVGATDASAYTHAGIKVYGFTPGILPKNLPLLKMAHGHNERLPVSFIETGMPALWGVVQEFCVGSV
jgi:acetylornithine deacetylase/succinyl-diaminopimelate desuccinylase-like protein